MRESLLFYILKEVQPLSPSSILDLFPPHSSSPTLQFSFIKKMEENFGGWMFWERKPTFFFPTKKRRKTFLSPSLTHTHVGGGGKEIPPHLVYTLFVGVGWASTPIQKRYIYNIRRVLLTTTCLASPVCAQVKWKSQKVDECKIGGGKWNERPLLYFLPFGNDLLRLWKGEKPKYKRDGHEIHKNYPSSPIFFYPYFFFYIYIPCVTP